MSAQQPTRIMVVDDHPALRSGLSLMLSEEPDMAVVAEAANGREAVERYRQHLPDVTLMDLRMPGMGGIEAIEAIRAECPDARVILLTAYDGDDEIYRGLRAGAQAFVHKSTPCAELLDAVRSVRAGRRHIPPEIGEKLAERTTHDELTEREGGVLRLMCRGKTNAEIGEVLCIAEGTVKFHVNRVLSKLGAPDRTQAVITALRRGLATLD